ncbi:MAG: GNAT family N-acetyltransferase [Syntrophobacteraceae bacterium]
MDPDSYDQKRKKANVVVRQMEIDDIATVFHLGERLFTAKSAPNLFRTWDEYEVINFFQNDSEYCLVAETDDDLGLVVGFVLGTTVTKSHSAWKYGYLVWLGVDPAFHESGIASKLFNRFRDLMLEEGVRMLLVDSEADNLPALHFFRRMGFGHPQEHIYLALNLDPHRQAKEKKNGKRNRSENGD